ncbi:MurNAc alpha-1-phosphate uridylyltransferase [Beijerinckia sp. 28-YEA-48]|nr:MurNAc alpha-1-phosphate uridylyltransferase [Beijerinckia sp. 28-YEA-48]
MPHTAMVFAAGLGTRMRPITDKLPKPLVEVRGKPLIDHMLDRFAEAGVEKAVVNVHYMADDIERHLKGRTAPQIVISDERAKLLDQGGGIVKALPELGTEPFFISNTDSLWVEGAKSNIDKLAEHWDPEKMDVLLLVAATASSIGVDWAGDFHMLPDGRLVRRDEREVSAFAYAGLGIMKPELFAGETRDVFRLAPIFFAAAEAGRLYGARLEGMWLHVGTPEAIGEAEQAIARSAL